MAEVGSVEWYEYGDFPEIASEQLQLKSCACPRCHDNFTLFVNESARHAKCPFCYSALVDNPTERLSYV